MAQWLRVFVALNDGDKISLGVDKQMRDEAAEQQSKDEAGVFSNPGFILQHLYIQTHGGQGPLPAFCVMVALLPSLKVVEMVCCTG